MWENFTCVSATVQYACYIKPTSFWLSSRHLYSLSKLVTNFGLLRWTGSCLFLGILTECVDYSSKCNAYWEYNNYCRERSSRLLPQDGICYVMFCSTENLLLKIIQLKSVRNKGCSFYKISLWPTLRKCNLTSTFSWGLVILYIWSGCWQVVKMFINYCSKVFNCRNCKFCFKLCVPYLTLTTCVLVKKYFPLVSCNNFTDAHYLLIWYLKYNVNSCSSSFSIL